MSTISVPTREHPDAAPSHYSELRISYLYVLPILANLGMLFAIFVKTSSITTNQLQFQAIGILIYVMSFVVWLIHTWSPALGQACMLALWVFFIYTIYYWSGIATVLVLLSLPVIIAAVTVHLRATLLTSVISSLPLFLSVQVDTPTLLLSLVSIWGTAALLATGYWQMYRVSNWFWNHYQQTQSTLQASRDQKGELKQTLHDLERANLNLTRLNRLAAGLRLAAEEAHATKAQFVANVSHELRTPLNMIIGFAEMMLVSPPNYGVNIPPMLLADLAVIQRNAEHLAKLINDILDLSQLEVDQMALTKEYVHIPSLVETSIQAVRPLYQSKHLYLTTEIEAALPPVFCDQTRIREVLLNLLSNAGRFMEHGGASIRVWQEAQNLMFAIKDTGPGISPEDMPRLFQPFHQLDTSTRHRYGGTGLGLSISKYFVELHEGKIWGESEVGKGATFLFYIPLQGLPPDSAPNFLPKFIIDWEYTGRMQPSLAPKPQVNWRMVVLDSENVIQRLLSRYWSDVEIVPARNWEEALQEISREPAMALIVNEAVVTDKLDHLSHPPAALSHIPIFTCAVHGVSQSLAELGIADRLIKPISRTELLDALVRLAVKEGLVLIVDDEPDALQLFSRMLASAEHQYRVLIARNGLEAMHILGEHQPNVILLDLVMPNMDGFALLELRKSTPAWQAIPVILISARDPGGQPIVSHNLCVRLNDGLSMSQLLASIRALCKTLTPAGQVDDPVPAKNHHD
ncbi:MAG: response regulator [Anaerolineae bacterium]|nr:response regulator [Anaerolineae bacterium]